ncbi:MAG: hypothetical protein JSW00_17215 [Thermoplasmata archaeon]|nr:MAG: hypothetical protein JSW00_17215 [Thermoplasmata archaeon]
MKIKNILKIIIELFIIFIIILLFAIFPSPPCFWVIIGMIGAMIFYMMHKERDR